MSLGPKKKSVLGKKISFGTKKKSIWVLRNTDFCGSETGSKISYLFWGRLNKNMKARGQKKGRKMVTFWGSKTGSNVQFFLNVFFNFLNVFLEKNDLMVGPF